jgi:hypothetical protein
VQGILADVNCQRQVQRLRSLCHKGWRQEVWQSLDLAVMSFTDLGLPLNATDRQVWQACQSQQIVLVTANRNAAGPDSLEATIQSLNDPSSLPVLTLADERRILRDKSYALRALDRLLEYLFDLDRFRGTGRLYIP